MRNKKLLILIIAVIVVCSVLLAAATVLKKKNADPHAGQVYINDGFDMVWMTPYEGVDVNPFSESDFSVNSGVLTFDGEGYTALRGVDVSSYQGKIDWDRVAASGIDFAIIQVGFRGYTVGGLNEDSYFRTNINGALEAGLKVGVYFFSQAINVQEAIDEAQYVIERIAQYNIDMPVVFDWEKIESDNARTNGLDFDILTDCTIAFCETIKNAGYSPCVYFNRNVGYYGFDISKFTDYLFWVAVPGTFPDFYYAADMWQYSFEEIVPGISTPADINMFFVPDAAD